MKRLLLLAFISLGTVVAQAQAATRTVNLTWQAPSSGGVLNYTVYDCTVASGGTSCSPNTLGTPLATVTTLTYSTQMATGSAYGWAVVANYPPCTASSPLTTPCGGGGSATVGYYPVPPQGQGSTTLLIQIP